MPWQVTNAVPHGKHAAGYLQVGQPFSAAVPGNLENPCPESFCGFCRRAVQCKSIQQRFHTAEFHSGSEKTGDHLPFGDHLPELIVGKTAGSGIKLKCILIQQCGFFI